MQLRTGKAITDVSGSDNIQKNGKKMCNRWNDGLKLCHNRNDHNNLDFIAFVLIFTSCAPAKQAYSPLGLIKNVSHF